MSLLRHPFAPSTLALGTVPLDQDLIALLAKSYAAARADAPKMTGSFFRRLFLADPALRSRFPSDLTGANSELLETLDAIVSQLNSPRRNRRLFERLSRWFVRENARLSQFPLFVDCLVQAMREAAGPAWTAQADEQWRCALDLIAQVILQAARTQSPAPQPPG